MSYLVPSVTTKGTFKLKEPLQNLLGVQIVYECTSIQTFGNVISSGKDPFKAYYEPLELPSSDYDIHSKEIVHIVTLTDSSGRKYHIPSAYIESFPGLGGVPYTSIVMGLKLGAIPDQMDLSQLKNKLADTIRALIGVEAEPYLVKVSPTVFLDPDEYTNIEQARINKITETTTDYSKILEANDTINALRNQVQALEQYIIDNDL